MGTHGDLLARHQEVLPSWLALYYSEPISLVKGDGRRVWDAEGTQYLDFFGGILTTMTGYNIPEITRAIQEQADRIVHSSTLYLIEKQIELAEKLADLSGIPDAKVFFGNSGTEANDAAMMLSTLYRGSNQIIAIRNSYHGRSFAAVSLTGSRSWSPTSLSPLSVVYVHGGYKYRSPFGHMNDTDFTAACVDDLKDMLNIATAGDVAAMIAEPIQGVGGFVTPPEGFFGAFQEVLNEHGILYISDEVQTGFGRTGENFWGYQAHAVSPDVITFAKGIANGMAIGGVIARGEIMDSFKANSISTFGGNPIATAAAVANIDYLIEHDLQTNSLKMGNHLKNGLIAVSDEQPVIGEVRGKGLMIGVELVKPGTRDPSPEAASKVMEAAKEGGLLLGKGGMHGNCLRIAPPLTLTEQEAEEGLAIMGEAIASAGAAIT